MLSFFATLNLGTRALQSQRQGAEVAGHNLANVNNPAYARQRVNIETTAALPTEIGPQGTGAEVTSIQQIPADYHGDQHHCLSGRAAAGIAVRPDVPWRAD
jgi:flagellar hook-associated protein FlgK